MTPDDLENYLRSIGRTVESITGTDGTPYTVVRDITITKGSLATKTCDVAIARPAGEPYVMPSAIHTRPALLPMDSSPPHSTQPSNIGEDWQYLSRRYDRVPTPKNIWAHVLTILGER